MGANTHRSGKNSSIKDSKDQMSSVSTTSCRHRGRGYFYDRQALGLVVLLWCSDLGAHCWSPVSLSTNHFAFSPAGGLGARRHHCQITRTKRNPLRIWACDDQGRERGETLGALPWSDKNLAYPLIPETIDRRTMLSLMGGVFAATIVNPASSEAALAAESTPDLTASSFGRPAEGTKRIFLCRHGQTEFNRLKLMQGRRVDAPINDNGERQAALLGRAVSDQDFTLVASSSLQRAKQTADAVQRSQRSQKTARMVLPELDEIDFGEVDGMEVAQARATLGAVYMQWIAGMKDARAPGGESFREIEERCRAGMGTLLSKCDQGGSVLAVTHSALIRCYLSVSLDMPYAKAKALSQPNCCINVLDFTSDGKVVPVFLNDTRHLPPDLVTLSAPRRRVPRLDFFPHQPSTGFGLAFGKGGGEMIRV